MNVSQFIGAYKDMLTNYFNFKGRVSRKSFWYAIAVNTVVMVVLSIICSILSSILSVFAFIPSLYSLAVLLPSLGYSYRRVQDIDKNGLLLLVPLYNIYLFIQPGTDGANKFGEKPAEI
ncbi:MAG: DUF805 domain-containing protein [Mucispirillum sp.]|nr:DUF805 domain-containing protein [Mucispirillum sp.]